MRPGPVLALAALLLGALSPIAAADPASPARIDRSALDRGLAAVPDSWIFVFAEGTGAEGARRALAARGVHGARPARLEPRIVAVKGLAEPAVERLLDLPGLLSVQPDALLTLQLQESVPQVRGDALSLAAAGFPDADGEGVRACVVDSGIRATHEAFGGRVDVGAGANTADGGFDTSDVEGHGTHVASILAGNWPDGRQGLAPAATLVPVRACLANRTCPTSAVIEGIDHCADPAGGRAELINLSLGGRSFFNGCDFDALAMQANAAVDAGLVVVAASGNDGNDDAIDTPACGTRVISVGSVYDARVLTSCGDPFSEVDERACSSNAGPELDVCAPGVSITGAGHLSDTGLRILQGTSMATPHVSGLVALLLDEAPDLSPSQVASLLRRNAVDLGPPGHDFEYGHGRVDAVATLAALAPCSDCPDPGWGDLHPAGGDELLELADWLVLRRFVAGSDPPAGALLTRGDLSPAIETCRPALPPGHWCPLGDGALELEDLVALRQALAGLHVFDCSPCPTAEPAAAPGQHRRPGDVAPAAGGDDLLDVADVLRLLRFAVALEDPSAEELLRGDVAPSRPEGGLQVAGGDGAIDVSDVLLCLRGAVGLVELAWPAHELRISADFTDGVAAARLELGGLPPWAEPGGEGAGCGLGGGLDVVGEDWSVTCGWDPVELPSGSLLALPWYRAPEPIPVAGLALNGFAVDASLEEVVLESLTISP